MTDLLSVEGLRKEFAIPQPGLFGTTVRFAAVDNVSFTIGRGEVLGLVGESGSGKTTVGRCIVGLARPEGGRMLFDGEDLATLSGVARHRVRRRIQIVFQDPFSSLNPRLRVGRTVAEPMVIHGLCVSRTERRERVRALLAEVGLPPDAEHRFPHEFSGGQRQRIGIARALAAEPDLIIADEPVSALDVSVQAQVLNLLAELQARHALSILFISHDLDVVRHLCDRVLVMYAGRLVEVGPSADLVRHPAHPYTRALLSAVPRRTTKAQGGRIVLSGEIPSPLAPPSGCIFRTRCPKAVAACAEAVPPLAEVAAGRLAACSNPAALFATD
ncbi:MAG: ABC transporter ATP-binding protein [Alphaproteobacteria bacterium]|nr:ABC transporter ATP-binding protein [Alphaproteobacteria bacterium]